MLASSAPALNLTTFLAAIVIASLVFGLIPVLSPFSLIENVPKPTNATLSPATNASSIAPEHASNAYLASTFDKPAFSAIALINSDLFIKLYVLKKLFIFWSDIAPLTFANIDI